MWLEGANIPEYLNGTWNNHAPKRKRKLLLHRLQITKLARGIEAKGYTIVPLSLYFKDGRVEANDTGPRQEGIGETPGPARRAGQA